MNSKIKTLHVWLLKNNFKKEASDLSQLEGEEERDLSSPYELSEVEKQQLGQPATKTYSYISEEDYPILREDILSRRMGNYGTEDFKLDPELTAYTPGETLGLLENPAIKDWHNKMSNYKIPDEYKTIVFVACATTKPWGLSCPGGSYYPAYNKILKDIEEGRLEDSVFFVTISEPLGVVPQDMWDSFPAYDNPGLFKDTPTRSGMLKKHWDKSQFGRPHVMPFDIEAKKESINILSDVIKRFIENNRIDGRVFKSFVDYRAGQSGIATHTLMLNQAEEKIGEEVVSQEHRFPKSSRSRQRAFDSGKGAGIYEYTKEKLF